MKRLIIPVCFALLAITISAFDLVKSNKGRLGYTGAPGKPTCAGCHGSAGSGSVKISCSPDVSKGYIANVTYTVSVTVAEQGRSKFGFDCEAMKADESDLGSFSIIPGTKDVQILIHGADTNTTHTGVGNTTSNSHSFNFLWKAPESGTGTISFYTCGLAADGNGTDNSADHTYKDSLIIKENTTGITSDAIADVHLSVFPNPAHENIFLHYTLDKFSSVSAKLYSITGSCSYTLFEDSEPPGEQKKAINLPAQISPGIYILKLSAQGEDSYRRLILSAN